MNSLFNFIRYLVLGITAAVLIWFMNDTFVRTILSIAVLLSICFMILIIACPAKNQET